jgi:hypothetical protein
MTSLPFELSKYHKKNTKYRWIKIFGMNIDPNDFEFDYIYDLVIHETHCDLCGKKFLKSYDRHLDHDHITREVRNIICNKCNSHRNDRVSNTNTDERYISRLMDTTCINGCYYKLQIHRNGSLAIDKSSVDLNKLIKIRDEFIKNNPDIFT